METRTIQYLAASTGGGAKELDKASGFTGLYICERYSGAVDTGGS